MLEAKNNKIVDSCDRANETDKISAKFKNIKKSTNARCLKLSTFLSSKTKSVFSILINIF